MAKTEELSGVVSLDLSKAPEPHPQSGTIEAVAKRFEVFDEQSYSDAAALIQSSNAVIARVEAFFEQDRSLAHKLHASICEKIRALTAPWRAVRPTLEPKMKKFRADQERIRREAEQALERQRVEAERKAREEADRIKREADAEALRLKEQGQMRAAKETVQAAESRAFEVEQAATLMADVGVVLPETKPLGGPGESRPWIAEVVDMKAICLAIGKGEIPLEYLTPVRLQGDQMRPLVTVDMGVLNNIAKRMGKEDIGIPGAIGKRGLRLSFSSKSFIINNEEKNEDSW